ncbi:MAG: CRISPR-associated endonuclease Cas2 [bacterium]|nr:CRISPR-associated endonuclease Cas2 [bacterium]
MKISSSRKSQLLYKVLSTIGNAAIAISRHPARNSLSAYRALRDFEKLQQASERQLRYISKYIIDKKYIRIRRYGNERAEIELTKAGAKVVARNAIYDLRPAKLAVWDSRWHLVFFDIPNQMKSARDAFAATLKRLGFERYQKSVFICPYPCEEELEVIADYFNITNNIEIAVAERITHENSFKKIFGL